MGPIELERLMLMERFIPEWDVMDSILYVGACEQRFHFRDRLKAHIADRVDILEREHGACEYLRSLSWIDHVIEMDVTNLNGLGRLSPYDVILWSHGPETVPQDRVMPTLRALYERLTQKMLIVMCPWGVYLDKNGELIPGGNISAVYPDDLLREKFAVAAIGEKDRAGSNLLAWKRKNSWKRSHVDSE